jgi:hypothetical protein
MTSRRFEVMILASLLVAVADDAGAYDLDAHQMLGRLAGRAASIDTVFRRTLGLPEGAGTRLRQGPQAQIAEEWIGDGARMEDLPELRVLAHFHNPLAAWEDAGLTLLGEQLGPSSLLWQQHPAQDSAVVMPLPLVRLRPGGGSWSWHDARRAFLDALTLAAPEARESRLVDTLLTLGHLTHLVQDASVPAHTRNDSHLRKGPLNLSDGYENFVDTNVGRIPALASPPVRAMGLEFTAGTAAAPVPVARLLDSDLFGGSNAGVLSGTAIGLAEYSNGNFPSQDTIFEDFALPREQALEPQAPTAAGGGLRRYLRKIGDGEPVDFFVARGALMDRLALRASPRSNYVLTDRSHESYAGKLLPRAVGYSASLLDYFFRGRLETRVEVVDSERLRLTLHNGSGEPLDAGTLRFFAERSDGERVLLTDVRWEDGTPIPGGDVAIGPVASGGALPVLTVRPSASSDRFVAAYVGGLGGERASPVPGATGAVVGTVFSGGVRAEGIVPDGDRQWLRTADGVFPLGPGVDALRRLQWGDLDNTFVGVRGAPSDPATPDEIRALRIARPPGATDVPVTTNGEVDLETLRAVPFPLGLDLGISVSFAQSTRARQFLVTFETVTVFVNDPELGLRPDTVDSTPPDLQVVVDETVDFATSYRLVLDAEHLISADPSPRGYRWEVHDVGLDASQRLLALVQVTLEDPPLAGRLVAVRKLDADGLLQQVGTREIVPRLPVPASLYAVIDVERAVVLGATAAPVISIAFTEHLTDGIRQRRHVAHAPDGTSSIWVDSPEVAVPAPPDHPIVEVATLVAPPSGVEFLAVTGLYRFDLDALVASPVVIHPGQVETQAVYFLDGVGDARVFKAFRAINPIFERTGAPTTLGQGVRIRPGEALTADYLLLVQRRLAGAEGEDARLVRWSPDAPARTERAHAHALPPRFYSLHGATPAAALLTALDPVTFGSQTLLVDLAADSVRTLAAENLADRYVLLAPRLLYNTETTHFHALDGLAEGVLPLTLAPADPVSAFDAAYHLVVAPGVP